MGRHVLTPLLVLALLAGGCADSGAAPGASPATTPITGEVVVQAAASLTDAFSELADRFEAAHPGVTVILNLAGSQSLASQLLEGARADAFASASTIQMDIVADAGLLAGPPAVFATNELAIVVESGNPFGVEDLADLANPDLVLVLASPDVPAGAFAAQALEAAAVEVTPASLELDVRATLSRVVLGEADAAIVYATDLRGAADTVEGVPIPAADNVVVTYPIAVLRDAPNPTAGQAFVDLVRSDDGLAILAGHGFTSP